MPDLSTASTVRAVRELVIPQHGVMRRLITDQGSSFTSKEFAEEVKALGVRHVIATTERPQTNGLVERANGTLVSVIKGFATSSTTIGTSTYRPLHYPSTQHGNR